MALKIGETNKAALLDLVVLICKLKI